MSKQLKNHDLFAPLLVSPPDEEAQQFIASIQAANKKLLTIVLHT